MARAGERPAFRWRFSAPVLLLLVVLGVAAGLILFLTWQMTFYQDTWGFLMTPQMRRSKLCSLPTTSTSSSSRADRAVPGARLRDDQRAARILAFGSRPARHRGAPIRLPAAAGRGLASLSSASASSIFLGSAWEVLLWPFEIGFVGSIFFSLPRRTAGDRTGRGPLGRRGLRFPDPLGRLKPRPAHPRGVCRRPSSP